MLNVAYIGFGVSVREYHLPYVEDLDYVNVKYVYRRQEDIEKFKDYEPFYPEINFTTNIDDVLNDSEINLVVISAPDAFHVPYAKQCLNKGKNVLCEKPFARTSEEAKEVFELAKEKGLTIMPNHNRRFDGDYLAVKEVIESGKLGDIVKFESHYDYYKKDGWNQLPALYNLGVHTLDQIIGMFGITDKMVLDARSIQNPGEADDYYDLEFLYGNTKATLSTSMYVLIDYPRFIVHGTKGSLTLPPLIHNSGKKKVVGRHIINKEMLKEERWGTLVYIDNDVKVEEKVPVGPAHYERVYENLDATINNGGTKLVKDEQVIKELEILEEASRIAKNFKI